MHIQSNLLQNNYFLVFVLFLELGTTPENRNIYKKLMFTKCVNVVYKSGDNGP